MDLRHLALRRDWEAARVAGAYRISSRDLTLSEVGFVHASLPEQLDGVAKRIYADVADDLVVLVLDETALNAEGSPVRMEPAHPDDPDSELYPHIYGPIPLSAVKEVLPADFDEEGRFRILGSA
ncbi:MAG TPA: DUF952 domain-containing protein [Acidimicrobiia bacterium]|nr:DUF952 domain-containing protein [Acidimicrobiia bacterium]